MIQGVRVRNGSVEVQVQSRETRWRPQSLGCYSGQADAYIRDHRDECADAILTQLSVHAPFSTTRRVYARKN